MKKLHLTLILSLALITASAQQVYFIYIQTENEQPFYVTMDEKVKSSSASGYIILSKLVDSTYRFNIGFPQNKYPQQEYSVTIGKKDHGYILKDFGEKGWGLYDLQTLSIQMNNAGKTGAVVPGEKGEVSAFTEILAKAAGDPSLREKPVRVQEEAIVKKENKQQAAPQTETPPAPAVALVEKPVVPPVETIAKEDNDNKNKEVVVTPTKEPEVIATATKEKENTPATSTPIATNETVAKAEETAAAKTEVAEVAKEGAAIEAVYNPSAVKKWAESSTTEGVGLVYIDQYDNGNRDTIRLIIPNPKPAVALIKQEPEAGTEEKKMISVSELPVNEKKETVVATAPVETKEEVKPAAVVNNCRAIANGDDFVILRKRMAAADGDDGMIAEAKKYYKDKCFTTRQIRLLGTLFLTDEGKYNFFDASYKYAADATVYASLQEDIKDEYYATRFKAMLRN